MDRAIGGGNIPAHGWPLLHVVLQELPKGLAEDHVLEVGDFAHDLLGKGVRYGAHKQRNLTGGLFLVFRSSKTGFVEERN